jgi:hypothetical protein
MAGGGSGATDPYFASRVAVANLNTDLTDAKGKIWTAHGGAAVSGGWLNLDGIDDYISTPESADFDFGSGEFCVEAFVNLPASPGGYVPIIAKWQGSGLSFYFGINTARRLVLFVRIAGTNYFPEAPALPIATGTDTHVALYRIGSTFYVSVAGSVLGILSSGGAINDTSQPTSVGAQSDGSNGLAAMVRGVRATYGGTGGYGVSSFTPPPFPLPTS